MHCSFTRLGVTKESPEVARKNRTEFLEAAKKETDAERQKLTRGACENLKKESRIDFSKLSTEVRLLRDRGRQYSEALCACDGKGADCVTRAMWPVLDAEERACKVTTTMPFESAFRKTGEHRWISQSGPEGICKVARIELLEEEPKYSRLWTYTLTEVTGNTEPQFCSKTTQSTEQCSWKHPTAGLLNCEEVHLQ